MIIHSVRKFHEYIVFALGVTDRIIFQIFQNQVFDLLRVEFGCVTFQGCVHLYTKKIQTFIGNYYINTTCPL